MSTTKDIKRAVKAYIDTADTMYAIMIDGDWGCGKTYFWKNTIRPIVGHDEALYVSLFGLKDINDIENEIFKAMSFIRENAVGFFKGFLGKSAIDISEDVKLGGIGFAVQYGMQVWKETRLKKSKNLFICFDDMERWAGDMEVCLSYINKLVEHDGTKCLIIGNSKRIKDGSKKNFNLTKDKTIGFRYRLTHSSEDVFGAAFKLTNFSNKESETIIKDIYQNNEARINSYLQNSKCSNIRIVSTTLSFLDKIVNKNHEKFTLSNTASVDYFTALMSTVILIEMYRTSDEDKELILNPFNNDTYKLIKSLGIELYKGRERVELSEEDGIAETLLYKSFAGTEDIKRKGICSIVKNGFYRDEDFVEEFSDWKKTEDYEIYLDTFKVWYMDDYDARKIFENTYNALFVEKIIKEPQTLLLIADRMTSEIKRGVLNLDFVELKEKFRALFNDLYNEGKMKRIDSLNVHMGINRFVYCEDLYNEVDVLNEKYNEKKGKCELSQFWVKLESDPRSMNDLLDKNLHLEIFAQYENPNIILDSLERLSNAQLFEFTRWMGSRVSEKPNCLSAVDSEHTRAQAVVAIIENKYADKFEVRAGHFKQMVRILKNRKTDYDPEYVQEAKEEDQP
ncbi:MAG: hypothetical protein HOF76_04460 [Candidatus Scalindua sp.]|jgi:hypothetical protein|nr:hypothetical protein [Candidatus Scalindua sp.]